VLRYPAAIRSDDSGTFLAAMLQGIKPEIGEPGSIRVAENATDSAFISGAIYSSLKRDQYNHFSRMFNLSI
jgi:hypothetical protein